MAKKIYIFQISVVIIEAIYLFSKKSKDFNYKEYFCTFVIFIATFYAGYIDQIIISPVQDWLWPYRLFTIESVNWATILLTLFVADFFYYCVHRINHKVRFMWATHHVHHSPKAYNMSIGNRVGVTELISLIWVFYLPLTLIGFEKKLLTIGLFIVYIYQTWIHTSLIGKIPILDLFLNTPSNHRVHHGLDSRYYNKNFGGVFIIFDKMFSTYQPEIDNFVSEYGTLNKYQGNNPILVLFHEWYQMAVDSFAKRKS